MGTAFDTHNSQLRTLLSALLVFLAGLLVVNQHNRIPLIAYRPADQVSLPYTPEIDDQSYCKMAEGKTSEVPSPFTKRALYPWLARMVSRHAHLPLPNACMTLNCAAWGLLAYCLAALLEGMIRLPWISAIFLLTPVPLESLLRAYMPELFHTALLSLFFLLLFRRKQRLALTVLFLAFLTRESTLALCMICAWVGWTRQEKCLTRGSLTVLVLGVAAGMCFARLGAPNIHHLPDFVYLVLKLFYNFLRNVPGIVFWTNTMLPARLMPPLTWNLPPFLQWGLVRTIGVTFSWQTPLETVVSLLTVFGFAPIIFLRLWKNRQTFSTLPESTHVAFLFGLIFYFLAPCLGASVFRLVGEGWPLVWVAIPHFAKHVGVKVHLREGMILAACYLLTVWIPFLSGFWGWNRPSSYAWLLIVPALYVIAYRMIKQIEARVSRFSPLATEEKRLTFQ